LIGLIVVVASFAFWLPPIRQQIQRLRTCSSTRALLDDAAERTDDSAAHIEDLNALLPSTIGEGFTRIDDRPVPTAAVLAEGRRDPQYWLDEAAATGFQGGYEHWWDIDPGPIAEAAVLQFADHAGAVKYQDDLTYGSCTSSRDSFPAPEVAGSVGLQIWWSDGDISEQVSFVRGSRRFIVSIRAGSTPPRSMVLEAVHEIALTAR
jgi:hypothetical protein